MFESEKIEMDRETAIKILREQHDQALFSVRTALETLIPELRDSEDEKIRKWLINYFTEIGENWIHREFTCKQIVAYLEKQKEYVSDNFDDIWTAEDCEELIDAGEKLSPRFKELLKEVCHAWYDKGIELGKKQKEPHYTKRNALFDKCVENCDPEIMKEVSDIVDEILKIKQKPTLNWRTIEQATTKRTDEGDCVTTERMLIKGLIDDEDYRIIDKGVMVNKNLLCIPVSELNAEEQKPAEPSGEGISREDILNNIYQNGLITLSDFLYLTEKKHPIEDPGAIELTPKQDYSGLTDFERAIHRGFLCAGVKNVPVEIIKETAKECLAQITPVEWSEEDEKRFQRIISLLDPGDGERAIMFLGYNAFIERRKMIDFLKSLRPRPHWKPSEESMKALSYAIAYFGAAWDTHTEKKLRSLHEDLKKLADTWDD